MTHKKSRSRGIIALGVLSTIAVSGYIASAVAADPVPYSAIACPMPDTMDQLLRDSANLKISKIRINQSGYRPQDEKLFYYTGTSASSFSVINASTKAVAGTGTLTSTGSQLSTQLEMKCYYKASLVSGGAIKYDLTSPQISGTIYRGLIPDIPEGTYKVAIGIDTSASFVIKSDLYGLVKDALLKYFGIARCGNNDSWFHAACHKKDPVPGGWHDAGDHLKESQSMGYAMSVLGLCAAALSDRDQDHYAKNQATTLVPDGLPDVLVEAKVGSDFLISSWDSGGQTVTGMKTNIGDFGKDHGWWGKPEYQDAVPAERGGPPRPAVSGLGANTAGSFSAGLAFVGRLYKPYDTAYSSKCITIAKALYAWGKANQDSVYKDAALNGGGAIYDDMAFGALALWWATKDTMYRYDLLYNTTIGTHGAAATYPKGGFAGGWFVRDNPGPQKGTANTGWARLETYGLWGLYRLILMNDSTASVYGISSTERLNLTEDVIYCLIANIADVGSGSGNQTVTLPVSSFQWKGNTIKCDSLWGWMYVELGGTWMPNRYQAGNITELFCYYDIASKITGTALPNSPATTDWKLSDVKSILIKQLDYMLGMNPWDVSMITGVGNKSLNHPHHRAATPELQNFPGAFYKYRPPVGVLSGGYVPTVALYNEYMGGSDGYFHTEVSLDATTALFLPVMGLAKEDTLSSPSATIRTVYVGCDTAIIEIRLTRYGTATVKYGTQSTLLNQSKTCDSAGVFQTITLSGLTSGTTYYFDVNVKDLFGKDSTITNINQDNIKIPFTFTTLTDCSLDAKIGNVKICSVTSDSAEIFWYTPNGAFLGKVVYDTVKPPKAFTAYDIAGVPVKFHYVKLGGLKEQTTYYFYVQSGSTVDNNNGAYYTFTTPVRHVKFDIRAVMYKWQDMTALGMNVINQEATAYDSLDLRLYFRATDAENFPNDLGARLDIGIVYDEAGFQKSFDSNTTIRDAISSQKPIKMPDTYDPSDGTYAYYLSVPLWGVEMKAGSRIRLDVLFDKRSPYPPYEDLMNQAPVHVINDKDWSFGPHTTPIAFSGVPTGTKNDVDENYWSQPIDYYITVYRKGEFVWGYSPSDSEQATKKNYYTLKTQVTSPLSNPSDDYVFYKRVIPSVNVSGWAEVSPADGSINDIWVNGVKLADPSSVLTWNSSLNRYDFTIPVSVTSGTNTVDLTFFAGPASTCTECYGCAASDHNFVIEFQGAKQYDSKLWLTDASMNVLTDTMARIDTTVFNVVVIDTNGNLDGQTPDTLYVAITNPNSGDSTTIMLIETGDSTSQFRTASIISVVSVKTSANQIAMTAGDKIFIKYIDPTDPSDSSSAFLTSKANFPLATRGWLMDKNGDGNADSAAVLYGTSLASAPDSLRFYFPDTTSIKTVKTGQGTLNAIGNMAYASFAAPFANNTTAFSKASQGTGTSYFAIQGILKKNVFPVADSIGPVITSGQVVERLSAGIDTLYTAFSEGIPAQTLVGASLILIKNGISYIDTVTAYRQLSGGVYAISLSAGSTSPRAGDSLRINPSGSIKDNVGNEPHNLNRPVLLGLKQIPAGISNAYYTDREGGKADGIVDAVTVQFNKKVYISELSFSLDWGNSLTASGISDSSLSYTGSDSLIVNISAKNVFSPSPGIKTSGTMRITPYFSSFPGESQNIEVSDSAAPVIVTDTLAPDQNCGSSDTLTVVFSEPVDISSTSSPFIIMDKTTNTRRSPSLFLDSIKDNTARFIISSNQSPKTGDSIKINSQKQICDTVNIYQLNDSNRIAAIHFKSSSSTMEAPFVQTNPFSPGILTEGKGTSVAILPRCSNSSIDISMAKIKIYDALGNFIFSNENAVKSNNGYYLYWNGYNRSNRMVSNGVYQAIVTLIESSGATYSYKLKIGVKR